jgi:hypothetical protein
MRSKIICLRINFAERSNGNGITVSTPGGAMPFFFRHSGESRNLAAVAILNGIPASAGMTDQVELIET